MPQAVVVNKFGTLQGWNSITLNMLGRDLQGITALGYSDEVAKENAYAAGMFPVGRTEGNYEPKANITLLKEEVDALQASLPPGMRLQDIPAFPIIVVYQSKSGQVLKDIINNCEFTGHTVDAKQGDGSIAKAFELIPSHIDWGLIA
ncbi:hypothetical protein D3C72_344480 [compost metagenome]